MSETSASGAAPASIDPAEVAQFARLAESWWDPNGVFKPLHQLNPARITFLRDHLLEHFSRAPGIRPFEGLQVLDIGCGGGLVAEPLARLGATVVGLDPSEENIAAARLHAERTGLSIEYRAETAEALSARGATFDVVLALEVVEHVADAESFIGTCSQLTKPGGAAFFATLNRTLAGYLLGIVAAEYVLRWLPAGTHQWSKFLKPAELVRMARRSGLTVRQISGLSFRPLSGEWVLSRDLSVNYLVFSVRDAFQ